MTGLNILFTFYVFIVLMPLESFMDFLVANAVFVNCQKCGAPTRSCACKAAVAVSRAGLRW